MIVRNEIKVLELNGSETQDAKPIFIESHWNRAQIVVVELHGVKMAVLADELIAAVQNARNTGRM